MLILPRSNRRRQLIGGLNFSNCLNKLPFGNYFSSTYSVAAVSSTAQNGSSNLMVDYLVNTIGLSRNEAISASTKVSHLKSTQKPDSILNFLKIYGGLDKSLIRKLVSSVPQVLLHKPDENLESKFRVFKNVGLTGSNLVKLIKERPDILSQGLDTNIVPVISYLRQLVGGCDDKVVKAISKSSRLFRCKTLKAMPPNIVLLQQDYGFSREQIEKLLVCQNPRILMQAPERLQDVLSRVERDMSIPRGSSMFFYGFIVACSSSRQTVEKKFGVFRSFGWSDCDIVALLGKIPTILTQSESTIQQKLNFYVKELGFTPAHFRSQTSLLTLSLEKRVKPRNEVLKILKELELVRSSMPLYSVLLLNEMKFVERFLLPYKDEVPNLYETFTENTKRQPKA